VTGLLYPPFYPPAYPTSAPPVPVPEQLLANGQDLNTSWCRVEGLQTLFAAPPRRGANSTVPGRHGAIRTSGKHYDPAEVVVPMHVLGVNRASGTVPSLSAYRLHENIDHLLEIFHGDTVELEYVRGDGSSRITTAELLGEPVVAVRERSYPPLARVSFVLSLIDAFWTEDVDVSQTITGATGTTANLTLFQGSTAPIADAVIRFIGPVNNPRLAVGERWVQFNGVIPAGRELVLECQHWRASPGAGAAWSPSVTQIYREPGPAWLEFPPSQGPLTATFTHTGGGSASVEIAGQRKFLTA
jgi:hypothetical protein